MYLAVAVAAVANLVPILHYGRNQRHTAGLGIVAVASSHAAPVGCQRMGQAAHQIVEPAAANMTSCKVDGSAGDSAGADSSGSVAGRT